MSHRKSLRFWQLRFEDRKYWTWAARQTSDWHRASMHHGVRCLVQGLLWQLNWNHVGQTSVAKSTLRSAVQQAGSFRCIQVFEVRSIISQRIRWIFRTSKLLLVRRKKRNRVLRQSEFQIWGERKPFDIWLSAEDASPEVAQLIAGLGRTGIVGVNEAQLRETKKEGPHKCNTLESPCWTLCWFVHFWFPNAVASRWIQCTRAEVGRMLNCLTLWPMICFAKQQTAYLILREICSVKQLQYSLSTHRTEIMLRQQEI